MSELAPCGQEAESPNLGVKLVPNPTYSKRYFLNLTQAQNSADREPRSARILLFVEYAPHVSVKVKTNKSDPNFKFHHKHHLTFPAYNVRYVSCFRPATSRLPKGRMSYSTAKLMGILSRCHTGKFFLGIFLKYLFRTSNQRSILQFLLVTFGEKVFN